MFENNDHESTNRILYQDKVCFIFRKRKGAFYYNYKYLKTMSASFTSRPIRIAYLSRNEKIVTYPELLYISIIIVKYPAVGAYLALRAGIKYDEVILLRVNTISSSFKRRRCWRKLLYNVRVVLKNYSRRQGCFHLCRRRTDTNIPASSEKNERVSDDENLN